MNKITKSIQILLAVLFLCVHCNTMFAQTLNTPIIAGGGSACDTTGATDFSVEFSFSGSVFNADNIFFIEFSDENGSFADATKVKELRKLESTAANNYNQTFNINTTFRLPEDTFGKNYKIRIRTTSPEMTSESVSFEAYHNMVSDSEIGINNDMKFALCNGESKEVSLTTDVVGQYKWFKRVGTIDTLVGTTQDPKFTITEPGTYFVVIDYGSCGGPKSRFIIVSGIGNSDAQIKGAATVEICGDEAHTFEAISSNTDYTYEWYKDDVLKQSSNSNTYTTPTTGQLGIYHLVVKLGDCEIKSSDVELKQKGAPAVTVTENVPLLSVLLPGENKDLSVTINGGSNFTIEWYKDNNRLFGVSGTTINVNIPGSYVARVVESSSGGCLVVSDSQPMVLLNPKTFNPIIVADDSYEACKTTNVELKVMQVNVIAEDDNEYVLTSEQQNLLNYQWKVNSVNVSGAIAKELTLNSHIETGVYTIEVSVGVFVNMPSNELDIKLIVKDPEISSNPSSNSLCPGGDITYTVDVLVTGYTYEWFKDGETTPIATNVKDFVVNEVGNYVLKITGFGCEKVLEPIKVVLFDASAIKVTPSEKVILTQGATVTVTASGAESYMWYEGKDTTGTLLSTSEILAVNTLGFYTVVAGVGACTVEKTIEAVEQDDQVIVPNIVTPNGDGINDTWKISNKYSFQPLVVVQLYNSNGKEILSTSDYKNDWPLESLGNQKIFYYKIIKEDMLIKAGTISVLD